MRFGSLSLAAALLQAVVGLMLVGAAGDPTALRDAPRNLSRMAAENAFAVTLLALGLALTGALAYGQARRGRAWRAAGIGAGGAFVAAFLAFLLMNDLGAPWMMLGLTALWAWPALLAGALLPLALAAARGRRGAPAPEA